jgi:hypothetical protein
MALELELKILASKLLSFLLVTAEVVLIMLEGVIVS